VGPEHRRATVARLPGREGRVVLPGQREALLRRALAVETDEVLRQVELDLSVRNVGGATRGAPVSRVSERDRAGNTGVVVDGRRPRQDSNLRRRLRRPMLYPLSYEGGGCRLLGRKLRHLGVHGGP